MINTTQFYACFKLKGPIAHIRQTSKTNSVIYSTLIYIYIWKECGIEWKDITNGYIKFLTKKNKKDGQKLICRMANKESQ